MEHAYKAVDGDLDSQWASVAMNDQWLWVDLLGLYAVNRIVLLFGDVPQQFVPGPVASSVFRRYTMIYIHTHTHTYIYICIYEIYLYTVSYSPKPEDI